MQNKIRFLGLALIGLMVTFDATPAAAYLGPGFGAGAISAIIGIVASLFVALFAILYYPIKRALRRRRAKDPQQAATTGGGGGADDTPS